MSDEQEHRRDPAGRRPQPDETQQYGPLDHDDATRMDPDAGAGDATRASGNHPDGDTRSGDGRESDRTAQLPPADDPTAVTPGRGGRDATSIMPPVGDDERWGAAGAPWSGRAEVRPPGPGEYQYTSTDWSTEPTPEPRGKWWMPILIGILARILLAGLGWGIWLIAKAQDEPGNTPTPAPATSAAPETTPPSTQATPEAPTTQPTTEAPPTPSEVTIPALRGLSQQEAQQALSRRGLSSRLRFVNTTDAPPGTVIDSDPAEGQEVPPDTVVTLVIAAQPATSPTPSVTDQTDED